MDSAQIYPDALAVVINPRGDVFLGTNGGGAFRSTDGGLTWDGINGGLADTVVSDLSINNEGYIVAGTPHGVFRTVSSSLATVPRGPPVPPSVHLSQNYPNPFNSATNISFDLPRRTYATIKVFDVLGREVSTLVDDVLNAGPHIIAFAPGGFSTGVYFYQLRAGGATAVKKMVLVK